MLSLLALPYVSKAGLVSTVQHMGQTASGEISYLSYIVYY